MSGLFGGLFGSGPGPASFSSRSAASHHSGQAGGAAYSFARLQQLYERLSRFKESDLERSGGGDAVVETVRQITEALIWGEQNDTHFFDFFCEKSILADFVRVLGLPRAPKKVKLQLLQTLQMLVQNIRQQTSVYYLLSNNHVNRLITTPLDFNDEEVLAYYITLMKSLALRLDTETIKFFFIQHREAPFPLYIEATKFIGHRDQMVRATVRTITLQVYSVQDEPMQQFVLRHSSESYFTQLALNLRDLWLRLDVAAAGAGEERALAAIQGESELQQDLQIYLSDVFELGVAPLNEVLADRLLNCVLLPVLLAGVAPSEAGGACGGCADGHGAEAQRTLAPTVALFLLRQVLETFRSPVLLEPLLAALLQPCVPAALAYALPQCADVAAEPPAAVPPDFVQNFIPGHFQGFLRSDSEAHVLLSAAVVHACACRTAVTPGRLAESPELLLLLLDALRSHASWQLASLQVYARILLDIFLGSSLDISAPVRAALRSSVESCLRASVERFNELLQESIAGDPSSDGLLDVIAEEWELHQSTLPEVHDFSTNPRRLLPCSLWTPSPGCQRSVMDSQVTDSQAPCTGDDKARRVLGAFLLLRRLLTALEQRRPEAADSRVGHWAGPGNEPQPLQMEDPAVGTISEGTSFDMGTVERIVCGVASPNGKCTRYLLLHDHWLLLVQPDLAAPGWAVAKTVRPIWQVQSLTDRSDPRTLQLALRATPGDKKGTGIFAESGAGLVTMCLNFKDVERAHAAAAHLQKRRQDVRAKLLQQALAFTETCMARLPPEEGAAAAAANSGAA